MLIRKIWEAGETERPREKLLVNDFEAETIALGYVSIKQGQSTQLGYHDDEEEIYVVLAGSAHLELGDETAEVDAGTVVYVPRCTAHRMTCTSEAPLEYLYFANWPKE